MKALRIVILALLGLIVPTMYDLLALLISQFHTSRVHSLLGFGIWYHYTSYALILALPVSIGVGQLWFKWNWKRWMPHLILLVGLAVWASYPASSHPLRTGLFMVCAFFSIVVRWFADWLIISTSSRALNAGGPSSEEPANS